MLSSQDYPKKLADSALAWWREAGVDYVCDDQAMNWLIAAQHPRETVQNAPPPPKSPEPARVSAPSPAPKAEWSANLAKLKADIQSGLSLPGCGYGNICVPPVGEAGAMALVMGDFPEEEEIAAGQFVHGPVAKLRQAMLLSAEILPDLSYQTALAHSRPTSASLAKADLHDLGAFARHQIALVKPHIVILFGSAACEALLSQDLMQARGNLHYINHDDRKTAAIATFHPRTLMAQPQLKAQAWKDLQMLARKDYL